LDLKGKAAVVTGASSDDGVGAECAKILASRGCNVVVNYATNRSGGDKVAAACAAAGARSLAMRGDVAKDDDCRALVRAAIDAWERLDVLINNAAVTKTIPHRRFDLLDADEFQRNYAVNLIGNYPDVPGRRAASQGDRRRRDREHLVDRRDARRRQLDGLCRLQGRSIPSPSAWRGRWRRGCGSTRCARAACSAAGPARS
jgi:NAD(P)-dependent dehydrogenase (short-subunit alcohol dehydrogenase family)